MSYNSPIIATAALLFAASCGGAPADAAPQSDGESSAPARASSTPLQSSVTLAAGLDAIIQDAYIPANTDLPPHYHPGEEYIYVMEGSIAHREDGQEERIYRAGDALHIPAGKVHSDTVGDAPFRAIIFRVHPEGEPLSVAVE